MCAFARDVDVLTVEIEHIDADAMQSVADAAGCEVEPTPSTLRAIQVGSWPVRQTIIFSMLRSDGVGFECCVSKPCKPNFIREPCVPSRVALCVTRVPCAPCWWRT